MKNPNQFIFEFICTEWHYTAVTTFKERFGSILATLQFFCGSKKPRERVECMGFLAQVMQLTTVFMLHVFEKILLLTDCLSTYCQSKDATMASACSLVESTTLALRAMRNDNLFDSL